MIRPLSLGILILALAHPTGQAAPPRLPAAAKRNVDFDQDIRPIFARHCFACHGSKRQESDYRLDRARVAISGGDRKQKPIRPGHGADSPLLLYAARVDPDNRMPPDGPGLDARELGLLRAWIDQGARFPQSASQPSGPSSHWSFQELHDHNPPRLSGSDNPIDAFVGRRLADEGLDFSPQADPRTLVRRLHLDLLGLPPTPETVDAFVADTRPDAWGRLVERALAHPHYGERWARHWLDVVRFAESHGFETNRERTNAWHFRDWCIDALNADMPYDRFVVAQLAGDAINEELGTGFLVAGPYDVVKSPDVALTLAQRQDELADMVNTTGTAFLGLTIGCARCHDHKFDPVPQTDYYALAAVFAGVQHADRTLVVTTPTNSTLNQQGAQLRSQLNPLRKQLAKLLVQLRPPVNPRHNIETFPPVRARFVRFTIRNTNSSEPCLDELEIYTTATPGHPARNVALASNGTTATSSGNFRPHPFHKLAHINDGQYGNSRSWISSQVGRGWVQLEFAESFEINRIEWGRDRQQKYRDRLPTRYWIEVAESPGQWREIAGAADRAPVGTTTNNRPDTPFRKDRNRQASLARGLQQQIHTLESRLQSPDNSLTAYVGRFDTPPVTHRLYRGDAQSPREPIAPGGLGLLTQTAWAMNEPEQSRRLKLARGLVRPDNPLTPRVIANRLWHYHFGTGLVATPGDFGANGTRPSHPELLDWMARRLTTHGWSLKSLHRQILNSKTWRQSSRPHARGIRRDSETRLLWRFPPRRLAAEAIRDSMLATSGAIDQRMHGPGFKVFEIVMENVRHYFPRKHYTVNQWRRMVYMTKIRQEQDEVFGAFDCPDGNQVIASRSRSTTPLQALGLLNGRFVLQQARLMAQRCEQNTPNGSSNDRVTQAFRLAYARLPSADELEAATRLANQHGLDALTRALLNSNEFLWLP